MQNDIVPRILALLQKSLAEHVGDLTKKKFTGTLSVTLECAFNQGGLGNIKKEISHQETIKRGE